MKPAHLPDAKTWSGELHPSAGMPLPPTVAAAGSSLLGPVHMQVFEVIVAQDEPLTIRRLAWLTKLPAEDLRTVVENLVELRLLRRLNTVIESYVAAPRPGGEPA